MYTKKYTVGISKWSLLTSSIISLLIYKLLLLLIAAHLPQFRRKKFLKNVFYFLLFSYITAASEHLLSKCFLHPGPPTCQFLTKHPHLEVLRHLQPETHKNPQAHPHGFTANTQWCTHMGKKTHTNTLTYTDPHQHFRLTHKLTETQPHPSAPTATTGKHTLQQAHCTPSQLGDTSGILKVAGNGRWGALLSTSLWITNWSVTTQDSSWPSWKALYQSNSEYAAWVPSLIK